MSSTDPPLPANQATSGPSEPVSEASAPAAASLGVRVVAGVTTAAFGACLYAPLAAWRLGLLGRELAAPAVIAGWFALLFASIAIAHALLKRVVERGPLDEDEDPDALRRTLVDTLGMARFAAIVFLAGAEPACSILRRNLQTWLEVAVWLALLVLTLGLGGRLVIDRVRAAKDGRTAARGLWLASAIVLAVSSLAGLAARPVTGANVTPYDACRAWAATPLPADLAPRAPSGLRVLVVAIDGGDLDELLPAVAAGKAPHFARLVKEGAALRMHSDDDPKAGSAVLWTAMGTGVPRAKLQMPILELIEAPGLPPVEIEPLLRDPSLRPLFFGGVGLLLAHAAEATPTPTSRRAFPAIWRSVSERGGSVRVVGIPATWPAEAVRGEVVTDRARRTPWAVFYPFRPLMEGASYPPEVGRRLVEVAGDQARPAWDELASLADWTDADRAELADWDVTMGRTHPERWLSLAVTGDAWSVRAMTHLQETSGPRDLTMCALYSIDMAAHCYWDASHPADYPDVPAERRARYGSITPRTWELGDRWLGELLAGIDDRTVVLVVSDHGMKADLYLDFNAYHAPDAMLLAWRPGVVRPLGVSESTCELEDVAPTILHLLGYPPEPHHTGRALRELLVAR